MRISRLQPEDPAALNKHRAMLPPSGEAEAAAALLKRESLFYYAERARRYTLTEDIVNLSIQENMLQLYCISTQNYFNSSASFQ